MIGGKSKQPQAQIGEKAAAGLRSLDGPWSHLPLEGEALAFQGRASDRINAQRLRRGRWMGKFDVGREIAGTAALRRPGTPQRPRRFDKREIPSRLISTASDKWRDRSTPTGDRKSSADNEGLWPIRKYERTLKQDYERDIQVWLIEVSAWKVAPIIPAARDLADSAVSETTGRAIRCADARCLSS